LITTKLNGYRRKRSVKTTKFVTTAEEQAGERQTANRASVLLRQGDRKKDKEKKTQIYIMSVLVALGQFSFPGAAAWSP